MHRQGKDESVSKYEGTAPGASVGRKGDPRMHRAVSAKMNDPSLSAYQALRMGGFDYAVDDDSSCLPDDNISLAQRKNQLSRRIRLNKQQTEKKSNISLHAVSMSQQAGFGLGEFVSQHSPQLAAQAMPLYGGTGAERLVPSDQLSSSSSLSQGFAMQNMGAHGSGSPQQPPLNPYGSSASLSSQPEATTVHMAMASLQIIAQNNGLSLEQLAATLRRNPGLLRGASMPLLESEAKRKQDLALNLYLNESAAHYRRSMLMAGFRPEECEDSTQENLDFCLRAWKAEGERLQQRLLGRQRSASVGGPMQRQQTEQQSHSFQDQSSMQPYFHQG